MPCESADLSSRPVHDRRENSFAAALAIADPTESFSFCDTSATMQTRSATTRGSMAIEDQLARGRPEKAERVGPVSICTEYRRALRRLVRRRLPNLELFDPGDRPPDQFRAVPGMEALRWELTCWHRRSAAALRFRIIHEPFRFRVICEPASVQNRIMGLE